MVCKQQPFLHPHQCGRREMFEIYRQSARAGPGNGPGCRRSAGLHHVRMRTEEGGWVGVGAGEEGREWVSLLRPFSRVAEEKKEKE